MNLMPNCKTVHMYNYRFSHPDLMFYSYTVYILIEIEWRLYVLYDLQKV